MRILGISALYHDSAAALIKDGRPLAAAQEERFTRQKHDARFPVHAIQYCLDAAGCSLDDLDAVVFYDKPFLKFERLLETYLAFAPRGFRSFAQAMPIWLREKLFQKDMLRRALRSFAPHFDWEEKLLFSEHHLSHAASAFYPSPFDQAAVLTLDGVGEWATSSLAMGTGARLDILQEIHFPHSLGLLYSAFTSYAGFKVNSGEYKLMGLAPYGRPIYAQTILDHLIDLKPDGSFRLDMRFFDYATGLRMTNARFDALFGQPSRKTDDPLTPFHMDIAASIQAVTEEVVVRMARHARAQTGARHLCLAGGVALNCVANGKILREDIFDDLWIQPAAGDAGGALGAALAAHYLHFNHARAAATDQMQGAYLGPSYDDAEVAARLTKLGARFSLLSDEDLLARVTEDLIAGRAVGWMQGRMEFGPRALGARSILADPRRKETQKTLNLRVKYRESFRPFAPSVLAERAQEWFELDRPSPYMLLVAPVHSSKRRAMTAEEEKLFGIDKLNVARSEIPAITHVDYSARVQTVTTETNPRYHALLSRFHARTGCPVLVNTSFNVRGEPIVCTPEDAFRCFMGCEIETLAIGNVFLRKEDQDTALRHSLKDAFEPD